MNTDYRKLAKILLSSENIETVKEVTEVTNKLELLAYVNNEENYKNLITIADLCGLEIPTIEAVKTTKKVKVNDEKLPLAWLFTKQETIQELPAGKNLLQLISQPEIYETFIDVSKFESFEFDHLLNMICSGKPKFTVTINGAIKTIAKDNFNQSGKFVTMKDSKQAICSELLYFLSGFSRAYLVGKLAGLYFKKLQKNFKSDYFDLETFLNFLDSYLTNYLKESNLSDYDLLLHLPHELKRLLGTGNSTDEARGSTFAFRMAGNKPAKPVTNKTIVGLKKAATSKKQSFASYVQEKNALLWEELANTYKAENCTPDLLHKAYEDQLEIVKKFEEPLKSLDQSMVSIIMDSDKAKNIYDAMDNLHEVSKLIEAYQTA